MPRCPHCLKAFYRPLPSVHLRWIKEMTRPSWFGARQTLCNLSTNLKDSHLTTKIEEVNCLVCKKRYEQHMAKKCKTPPQS